MSYPVLEHENPLVIGHRGSSGTCPENTLPSFAQALADSADMLESDLHLTRDGHVVMIHDTGISRTTGGQGQVSSFTLAELKEFDAGYNFSLDGGKSYPFCAKGIEIPTLAEVFNAFSGTRFHLDLKSRDPALAGKTLDLVESSGQENSVILTSFDDETLARLRQEIKERDLPVPVAASARGVKSFLVRQKLGLNPPTGFQVLSAPDKTQTAIGIPVVTGAFNRYAHRHGFRVYVWTVNEEKDMRRVLKNGADGIFTDFPAKARALVKP